MSKYTTQFKLAAVRRFIIISESLGSIACQLGLERGMFRRWVALYQQHGEAGLRKWAGHYSAERKIAILQHMWNNALSYRRAAAVFNVRNPNTLNHWESLYRSGGLDALQARPKGRPKKMADPKPDKSAPPMADDQRSREELLAELEWLRMENAYLKKLKALVQAKEQAAAPTKRKP